MNVIIVTKIHKPLIIKQFESKLETNSVELFIHGTDKNTDIEYMCSDTITYFYIWIQMGHKEYTAIKPFLLNHTQPTIEWT